MERRLDCQLWTVNWPSSKCRPAALLPVSPCGRRPRQPIASQSQEATGDPSYFHVRVSLGNLPKAVSISNVVQRYYRQYLELRVTSRPNDLTYFLPKGRIGPHRKDEQGTIDDLLIGSLQRSLQVRRPIFSSVLRDRPLSTASNRVITVAEKIDQDRQGICGGLSR